jgi:hypothetical protein
MRCGEFHALFLNLAFGDVGLGMRGRLEEHLGQCPSCAAEWQDYHRVIRLARNLPPAPVPPGLTDRVQTLLAAIPKAECNKGN